MKQGITSGNTAINILGDPLGKMNSIHQLLGQLYDDVCWQLIAMGAPACCNYSQQEEEIVHHFTGMWDDKQYDMSRLPVGVPDQDDLFMPDEPYMPGTTAECSPGVEEMDKDDPEEAPTIMPSSD